LISRSRKSGWRTKNVLKLNQKIQQSLRSMLQQRPQHMLASLNQVFHCIMLKSISNPMILSSGTDFHSKTPLFTILPADIGLKEQDQVVAASAFPGNRACAKKIIAKQMMTVTPTHDKSVNNKPSLSRLSTLQQPNRRYRT
jgi:hypothetical protein